MPAVLGVAEAGIGGWNEGGGCSTSYIQHVIPTRSMARRAPLTASNPPLAKILSVVAATLPPFRCKSHIISLRLIWGNIIATCSTSAGFAARGLERGVVAEGLVKKK